MMRAWCWMAACSFLVGTAGCGSGSAGAGQGGGAAGRLSVKVSASGPVHDVTAMGVKVVGAQDDCTAAPVTENLAELADGGLSGAPLPAGAGGAHPFTDSLFILAPGEYKVCATPLHAEGVASQECSAVTTRASVSAEATTEITLVSQCSGDPGGGLDVVGAANDSPVISDLQISPGKFFSLCGAAELTLVASDPNGDPITFAWAVVSGPAAGNLQASGATATFTTATAGDYQIRGTVTDSLGAATSLTFPLHVLAGDCECMDPRIVCEGRCVDPGSDPANCGACGHVCPDNTACQVGSCRFTGPIYLGGRFTTANGGAARPHLAAVDPNAGTLTPFRTELEYAVNALAISGSNLYLGGDFPAAGGVARHFAAAVDGETGAITSWDPNLSYFVRAVAVSGSTVYLGGDFGRANGAVVRRRAAAVDDSGGLLTGWNPDLNGPVDALAISESTVYLGGAFTAANGGVARRRAAAVDALTGVLTAWDPNVSGTVDALAIAASTVYLGGHFKAANGPTARAYAAAVDGATGALTPWNPMLDGPVAAMAISGSTVYLGGWFTRAGAAPRAHAAAVDLVTGAVTSWNPDLNGPVRALAVCGSTIYAVGEFSSVNGGRARNHAAAFDTVTGVATAWNPDLDHNAWALALDCPSGAVW